MDLSRYVAAAAESAGSEGLRHIDSECTSHFGQTMKGKPAFSYRADPTLDQLRKGFATSRAALTAAIDRLAIRVMPEAELVELERLMDDAITAVHTRCLGTAHLSEEVRLAMNESQELLRGKLDVFLASQRDKRRELEAERRFTVANTWRAALTGALAGGLVGFVTGGGLARFVDWIARAF